MSQRSLKPLFTLAATMMIASCGLVPGSRPLSTSESQTITYSQPDQLVPVEFTFADRTQLRALANAGMDIWSVDRASKTVKGTFTQAQYQIAVAQGVKITRRSDRFLRNSFDKGYHTYDTMLAELKDVVAKHPDLCELKDIGDSWEKTQGKPGHDLWAVHFKKGAGHPVVMFAGCTHAREIVTPEMILGMIHLLADQYGKDAEITADVNNRDIWLVPMVNPDGHVLASKGQNQRKNTNTVTGGKSRIGVDLNRNYDASWGTVGDSANPESDTFRGAKAFSEPETQAIRDLMIHIKPVLYMTYHSFSNSVMWSWDKMDAPPPDKRLEAIGKVMGKLSGYDAYQGCQMYLNSGDDVDWSFEHLGTLAYTVEVGSGQDGFDPPFSRVAKFWNENRPMMLYALKIADNPGAVSGPEIQANLVGTRLDLSAATPINAAEYFVGQPGLAGTGHAVPAHGTETVASLDAVGGRQLVFAHARGTNGSWGPWNVRWSR